MLLPPYREFMIVSVLKGDEQGASTNFIVIEPKA